MNGTTASKIKIVLRDPLHKNSTVDYEFEIFDHALGRDWLTAFTEILDRNLPLEKNFCFLGFPNSSRTIPYLCQEINSNINVVNRFNVYSNQWRDAGLDAYYIEEYFCPESVQWPADFPVSHPRKDENDIIVERFVGLSLKHDIMNRLHNHFERLQGTVWNPSPYYRYADGEVRYAIRQINLLCHELENAVLSNRKLTMEPQWVRPSQITTFLHAPRYDLKPEHRQGFITNSYDRRLGHVYLHWAQIGKTLYEVWRDEGAPRINVGDDPTDITIGSGATCEAINSLKFYSGEFDIEWGNDVVQNGDYPWHDDSMERFRDWIQSYGIEYRPDVLSLGYLELGKVDLMSSFGTTDYLKIWEILGQHLDIYRIEFDGRSVTYDYCWSDDDYKQKQMERLGLA